MTLMGGRKTGASRLFSNNEGQARDPFAVPVLEFRQAIRGARRLTGIAVGRSPLKAHSGPALEMSPRLKGEMAVFPLT